MSLREFPDVIQGSEEWHAQRRGMVTASVVGQLISVRSLTGIDFDCPECGAKPNAACTSKVRRAGDHGVPIKTLHSGRTARDDGRPPILEPAINDVSRGLTALLTAERITGFTEPTWMNDDMMRGVNDEPIARDLYSEHFAEARETGFLVRDDWGFQIGFSPDGVIGDDGLLEVKSRRQKKQLMTILSGEVPPENMAQLQCGLLVSGRAWIDYVSFCGGMPLWRKRVHPDPVWFSAIIAAVRLFEENSAAMVATYTQATRGLPATERTVDLEMSL